MRRFLLAVSAVAVLVLGLEKVGIYQFIPGGNTGFQFSPLADGAGYSLRHANSAGNLTSWVELIVRAQGSASVGFKLRAWTGDPLAIVSRSLGERRFEVTISKQPNPPKGTPFVWGNGLELQIVGIDPRLPTTVEDWNVFPSAQAHDSLQLARRRHQWTTVSWVLFVLGVIGAVLTALKEKDATEPVTTRMLATAIVYDIVGESDEETKKLRVFMKKVVLEEVPVDQALIHAGFPKSSDFKVNIKRYMFLARATKIFRARVDNVVTEFIRYSERLKAN